MIHDDVIDETSLAVEKRVETGYWRRTGTFVRREQGLTLVVKAPLFILNTNGFIGLNRYLCLTKKHSTDSDTSSRKFSCV